MRRILAALLVLAVCSGVVGWSLRDGPDPAAAAPPGATVYTFTNTEASSTFVVEIHYYVPFAVSTGLEVSAPGCGSPFSTVTRVLADTVPGFPLPGIHHVTQITWLPLSGCIDPGESVQFWIEPASMVPPTADFTPATHFQERTFTNTSGLPANALDVQSGAYTGFVVTGNAPACAVPTIGGPEFIRLVIRGGAAGGPANLYDTKLRWPSTCVDPGESVTVIFEINNNPTAFNAFSLPITSTFFDSAVATVTPTFTPTATFLPTETPTSFPPPGVSLVLDCDVNTAGIQSTCTVPLDAGVVEVDAVAINNSGLDVNVAAFDLISFHTDAGRLDALAPACLPPGVACNPDFDEAALGLTGWSCGPPFPNPDIDVALGDRSYIGCYNLIAPSALPDAGSLRVARVRYAIPLGAAEGSVSIQVERAALADEFETLIECADGFGPCFGASINLGPSAGITVTPTHTPTPTATPPPASTPQSASTASATPTAAHYLALDCALSLPGIQSHCTYLTSDTTIDVGFVLVANTEPVLDLSSFNVGAHNLDASRLFPPTVAGSVMDSNPDVDQMALNNVFGCSPPLNYSVVNPPPGATFSHITCGRLDAFTGPTLALGQTLRIGHVRYDVQPSATPGLVPLDFFYTDVYDGPFHLLSCDPPYILGPCLGAAITFIGPPPTATPTATDTPVTGIQKVPDGNANNTDPDVPAANLWICELGPCAGPGEGALRVVELATDVLDGLGAYEFTVEYDNFVISSVNPCDIVFGPGGAGDDRGPVDEEDESAINPDCTPDPGPGGGTCSYSHILENVIHFGCATAGQAPGPTGDMDLASLLLIPHEDLVNDLFPGNENGVLTVIKDNGCELVDILGHPVSGSINGGLVPICGNLAVTVRILEGDLDLNCEVNVTDAQLIAGKYGAFFGSLLYTKWYDLEPALHDLDIDIKDIQKVFGRDGSNCQVPVPPQPPLDPPSGF